MYFKTDKNTSLSCVHSVHMLVSNAISKNELFLKYFLEYEHGVK